MDATQSRPALIAAIELVASGAVLPATLAEAVMEQIMDGDADPAGTAALLAMLHLRGETAEEVAAFARVMRVKSVRVDAPEDAVDLCGTGGDGSRSFNISTIAAFVVAGAGAPVAKHGNRAATSRCGSADLIEALGLPLDPGPETVARSIRETGFGFIFAPSYHPAMRHVAPVRRSLPIRTVFNLLGPISSPARVRRQLVGVANVQLLGLVADALVRLEPRRALVVHSGDGLDELSVSGPNHAVLIEGRRMEEMKIDAVEFGLRRSPAEALVGGDAQLNSAICLSVLGGEAGPTRDVVLLNAGAALFVAGRAQTIDEGVAQATEAVDSGRAAEVVTAAAAISG
ncbi:MAG TPA: anthranilate phosphoribosyltransferase [Candidatus Limnocylindrales bacterium]|nr:anthranilate phosphoribosyltransferase [Candidatus Limnocylindrales bacterium]